VWYWGLLLTDFLFYFNSFGSNWLPERMKNKIKNNLKRGVFQG